MRVFHYNDEERQLHDYLGKLGHTNVVVAAERDPFPMVRAERFDAAFVGLHPHGMQLMRDLHVRNPDCFVTLITSDRDTRRAVQAVKAGAFDYLLSPLDFTEVERVVILMSRDEHRREEQRQLRDQLAAATGTPNLEAPIPVPFLTTFLSRLVMTKAVG